MSGFQILFALFHFTKLGAFFFGANPFLESKKLLKLLQ